MPGGCHRRGKADEGEKRPAVIVMCSRAGDCSCATRAARPFNRGVESFSLKASKLPKAPDHGTTHQSDNDRSPRLATERATGGLKSRAYIAGEPERSSAPSATVVRDRVRRG